VGEVFFEREVLQLALTYFLLVVGSYGMNMWIPTLVKRLSGGSNVFVGLLTSLAYSAGLAGLLIIGRHSDRTGERKLHTAIPLMVSSVGFLGSVLAPNPGLAMAFVMLALAGLLGSHGPFWSMPTQFLSAESAAVAIGLINSVGNLGGFVGPSVVGYIDSVTGSFRGGFSFLAASVFLSSVCALLLRVPRPRVT
jgi:ACS family tartrate transporter-like MFS transporter